MSATRSRLVVVTVVKDDVEGFERTCASLHRQTTRAAHLIVNGGSGAAMRESVDSWASQLASQVISGPDRGPYNAMNTALHALDADDRAWFINAGDTLATDDAYAYIDSATGRDDFVWGFGPVRVIEKSGELREIPTQSPYSLSNHAFGRTPICHQAAVCTVQAMLAGGGFDEHYSIAADYRAFLLLGQRCPPTQWDRAVVNYQAGGLSDRHLLRSHLQQQRARARYFNHDFADRVHSLSHLGRMTIRISAGRTVDLAARAGLVDSNWRRSRASKISDQGMQ